MTAPRHAAPEVGTDPATVPGVIRAQWVHDHGVRLLPAPSRLDRPRIPDSLMGADRMGGGLDPVADYLALKGEGGWEW